MVPPNLGGRHPVVGLSFAVSSIVTMHPQKMHQWAEEQDDEEECCAPAHPREQEKH